MDTSAKNARREKNREHARRSRARKMEQQETLENQANELREENARLRALVKSRLPDKAASIIGRCCYRQPLPDVFHSGVDAEAEAEEAQQQASSSSPNKRRTSVSSVQSNQPAALLSTDFELIEHLTHTGQSFVLTDPRLPDNPIVYASESFLELTGYARDKVLGRNARFLQGPETDSRAVSNVREAVKGGRDVTTLMLNYKADGTTFWNQFWVAALRDRRGKVMNYVGVQCAVDPPDDSELEDSKPAAKPPDQIDIPVLTGHPAAAADPNLSPTPIAEAKWTAPLVIDPTVTRNGGWNADGSEVPGDDLDTICGQDFDDDVGELDWAVLAETLEADYKDVDGDDAESEFSGTVGTNIAEDGTVGTNAEVDGEGVDDSSHRVAAAAAAVESPQGPTRAFVTKTVRSELIDCLVSTQGDATTPQFASALDILSSIYAATSHISNSSFSDMLHGSWRSLSRPSYQGCLGQNARGNFVYTLGKMSFNMFQPGNLRCSVQHTLNDIKPVCKMDGAPAAAPWSLRRELALRDSQEHHDHPHAGAATTEAQLNTMLKSYDIAVALTIEPGQFKAKPKEKIPSPASRLRALKVVQGYFLPDPDTPHRLTVWFTGGKLTPAPKPERNQNDELGYLMDDDDDEEQYGDFDEWKKLFGTTHKRTWGESFSVMGAKLFLGAEMSDGMEKDGTVRYTLHRPHGGHGKAYVDVLYLDEEVLITRGNAGTIHVMTRNGAASVSSPSLPPGGGVPSSEALLSHSVASAGNAPTVPAGTSTVPTFEKRGEKRKLLEVADQGNNDIGASSSANENHGFVAKAVKEDTADVAGGSERDDRPGDPENNDAMTANKPFNNLPPVVRSKNDSPQRSANDGVTNIMQSVEAFFGGGLFY